MAAFFLHMDKRAGFYATGSTFFQCVLYFIRTCARTRGKAAICRSLL